MEPMSSLLLDGGFASFFEQLAAWWFGSVLLGATSQGAHRAPPVHTLNLGDEVVVDIVVSVVQQSKCTAKVSGQQTTTMAATTGG